MVGTILIDGAVISTQVYSVVRVVNRGGRPALIGETITGVDTVLGFLKKPEAAAEILELIFDASGKNYANLRNTVDAGTEADWQSFAPVDGKDGKSVPVPDQWAKEKVLQFDIPARFHKMIAGEISAAGLQLQGGDIIKIERFEVTSEHGGNLKMVFRRPAQ